MSWVVGVLADVTSAIIPIRVALGRRRSVFKVVFFFLFLSVIKTFFHSLREVRRVWFSGTLQIVNVVLL